MRRLLIACLLFIMWADSNHASSQSDSSLFHLTHRIGRGTPNNIEWQPNGDKLLVSTVTGAWLYTDTLDDVAHIEDAKLATFHPSGRLLAGVDENNSTSPFGMLTPSNTSSLWNSIPPVSRNLHGRQRAIALPAWIKMGIS